MTDEPNQSPDLPADDADTGEGGAGRMMRFATGVAENLQKARESRPIAKVEAGTGRLGQAFSGSKFVLYADRLVTPKGAHPLTHAVQAEVQSAGGFKKKADHRELYLTIVGDGWSLTHQCDRRKGEKVRAFASAVNAAVRALPAEQPYSAASDQTARGPSTASDSAETIRQLGELRDAGVLTGEEFEDKKRELLDRM